MTNETMMFESFISNLASALLVLALVFLVLTLAFPALGCFATLIGLGLPKYKKKKLANSKIDILVPVYNEKKEIIEATLTGIVNSFKNSSPSNLTYRVVIFSDPMLQKSYEAVTEWKNKNNFNNNIEILSEKNISKWDSLIKLSDKIDAEWCAFVDIGSVWDRSIISKVESHILSGKFLCVAPSYEQKNASMLYRVYWQLESYLKNIENIAGGPCSVHGATVFYDSRALKVAIQELGNSVWYNDDIVIPLKIRTIGNTFYASGAKVYDSGANSNFQIEKNRRSRMTFGNIQWIKTLLIPAFRSNSVAGIISLRRAVRTFWAYVLILTLMYIAVSIDPLVGIFLGTIFTTTIFINKSLRAAFISSIKSIKNIVLFKNSEVIWS